jgi:hypothetical protein
MQPAGDGRELRLQLKELLQRADRLALLIQQAEAPRHAADRPRLTLIHGGKALVLAPVMWVWATFRENAKASTFAAAGLLAVPTTLGVGVATPEIHPGAPPVSTAPRQVDEQPELRPTSFASLPRPPTPTPTPTPTETAEAVKSEALPPVSPAPVSVPAPVSTPTPTPTSTPTAPVVEEVVWTRTTALVHCRDVLEVPAADLQDCVQELLAGSSGG